MSSEGDGVIYAIAVVAKLTQLYKRS